MAKKYAFLNPVPDGGGGGGTVLFVTKTHHQYLHVRFCKGSRKTNSYMISQFD